MSFVPRSAKERERSVGLDTDGDERAVAVDTVATDEDERAVAVDTKIVAVAGDTKIVDSEDERVVTVDARAVAVDTGTVDTDERALSLAIASHVEVAMRFFTLFDFVLAFQTAQ